MSEDVRAVAAFGLADTALRLPTSPLLGDAWTSFIATVSSERLLGLLHAATAAGQLPVLPPQADQVQELATNATRFCMMLESELLDIATLLDAAGVAARVLKGPAAAALDYPDPSLRPFIDIDLLVPPEEFDVAATALVDAGYVREFPQPRPGFDRRFSKGTSFLAPSRLAIDLHRTFVMGPYGLMVHLDDLWGPGVPFSLGRRTLQALSAEARLLHACYHAALGDWPLRLLPHRDIAQLLLAASCDEDHVMELARSWRGEAVLATAVRNTWQLLGITRATALSTWAWRYVPSARDRRALRLYAHPDSNYAAMSFAALREIHGVRDKAAFLLALAFPQRSYLAERHPTRRARLTRGLRQVLDVRHTR